METIRSWCWLAGFQKAADCKFQLVSSQIFGVNWALNSVVSCASFSFDLTEYKKHSAQALLFVADSKLNKAFEKTFWKNCATGISQLEPVQAVSWKYVHTKSQ